ncbi:MAG: hypothetical protein ACRDKJ_00170 [Actinomycetota bacterium]
MRSCRIEGCDTEVVVVADQSLPDLAAGDRVVWGAPVGAVGDATDDEIEGVLRNPGAARSLLGVWVIAAIELDRVRLVTSASLPHTLKRVEGPKGVAFATRGLAAHALAGRSPRISEHAVVEQVLFGYVLGSDEILEGTELLPEASVVDLDAAATTISSFWPIEERFAPTAPVGRPEFLELLTSTGLRFARTRGVWLGLTAGRDSTLLAAVLDRSGVEVPAFTMSGDIVGAADLKGARATASALGWRHDRVGVHADPQPITPADLKRWAAWHEGMQRFNDYTVSPAEWPELNVRWLSGHGGEIGRAFYWAKSPERSIDDPVGTLIGRRQELLPDRAAAMLHRRIKGELSSIRKLGRPRTDDLDVFYARQRMRKWVMRLQPLAQFADAVPAFLDPQIVGALLAVPWEGRPSGRLFDATIRSLRRDLARSRGKPRRNARKSTRLFDGIRRERSRRAQGVHAGVQPLSVKYVSAMRLFRWLDREGASVVKECLGPRWWDAAIEQASRSGRLSPELWNALSIEGLALHLGASKVPAADERDPVYY